MKKILLLILLLSFLLRFYRLTEIPGTLNPDEKYNAYLAYSLLHTGRDLNGNFFPVATRTFGNWTLIAYPALAMIPVAVMGLTESAARLPGAIAGVVGTFLIFRISRMLLNRRWLALTAAFLFAISPWNIFFSRISHETNLAVAFFLAGLFFFLKRRLNLAAFFWGLTLWTHYTYVIFTTAFLFLIIVLNRANLVKLKNILPAAVYGFFLMISVGTIIFGSIHEVKDVGILDNPDIIYGRVDRFKSDGSDTLAGIPARLVHNKYLGTMYQIGQNYLASFSPEFLFDKGGEKRLHNIGYFGNLYFFDFFLLLAGIVTIGWFREKSLPLLIVWLLAAPLSSAITKDAPSSTRLFPLMPLFVLAGAFGLTGLARVFKRWKYLAVLFCAFNFLLFLDFYFVHFNVQESRFIYYGYKEAAVLSQKYPGMKVKMIGPENFPFISFLFYDRYDPDKFRQEVRYYPQLGNGFQFVKSFGRYEFVESIDRSKLEANTLYFDKAGPGDKNTINLPGGEPIFTYIVNE